MGLFSKLKNTLFEEEDVVVDSTPEKVVIKEEAPKKEEPKKVVESTAKETDLFRADSSFDFPDFDEEEFMTSYERMKSTPKVEEKKEEPKERYERPIRHDATTRTNTSSRTTTSSRPSSNKENISIRREPKEDKPLTKKAFRPSPVISPVYGVLDKDYTKEDFVKAKENTKIKSSREVDKAIKKAFGTMDDDITKTINEPVKKFYREDSKSIDDLLKDSVDDTIDLDIDETNEFTDTMKVINKRVEKEQEEVLEDTIIKNKKEEDNTLESDLFDLIDSMYDNKEDD